MTDATHRVLLVDAFADEPLAGNAAGVVPAAGDLDEAAMRALARELGASETAFVRPPDDDDADRRLRFFSPTSEVDLCGHATVAAHAHLYRDGAVEAGTSAVETNVGVLDVEVTDEGVVWMEQDAPTVERVEVDYDRVGGALGIDPAALRDIGADMPVAVASTGLPFLVVPVNFLERLGEASPDDDAVVALTDEYDVAGVYAFTFDAIDADATLHGRAFAPGIGIPEDPVTGTASGAVGAYLREVEAFDGEFPDEVRCEQGHFVDRPGTVRVRVETADDGSRSVRVGGRAVTAVDGRAVVPETDDDIIEA